MSINNVNTVSPMLQKYLQANGVVPQAQAQPVIPQAQSFTVFPGSDLLKAYLLTQPSAMQSEHIQNLTAVKRVDELEKVRGVNWKNNLMGQLRGNEATIMAVIPRTMNAKDVDGNGLIQGNETPGNFVNAVGRLDEYKNLGINTLHILPIHPTGKTHAMGTAGSLYSPDDFLTLDPELVDENPPLDVRQKIEVIYKQRTGKDLVKMDKNDPEVVFAQCQYFIDECHKRQIACMLDLPSCASVDFANRHPELMAKEKDGVTDKTPGGWQDIRMFDPWENEDKRILNKDLL